MCWKDRVPFLQCEHQAEWTIHPVQHQGLLTPSTFTLVIQPLRLYLDKPLVIYRFPCREAQGLLEVALKASTLREAVGQCILSVLRVIRQHEGHQTVWQGQIASCRIQFILISKRLRRHTDKTLEPSCGSKSLSAHMNYRTFFTTTVHSGRSRLRAYHQIPPACTPSPQSTTPLLYLLQGFGPPVS